MSTPNPRMQFAFQSRILHWVMAVLIIAMLFIGIAMVASLADYHWLISLHRPIGIAILILAIIRLVNRRLTKKPALPPTMAKWERIVAASSERLLYFLMIALPLIGWGMLSAGSFPIVMFGGVHLPPILPAHPTLYTFLRNSHSILAYLLFAAVLAHLGAILFHTLIVRDRILDRMLPWKVKDR